MSDVLRPQHAFNHAPAALRIFRFAADSAPRVLELAHVSAFLRECAVEFGSGDATVPGAVRCDYAAKRFFNLRDVVERRAWRCPWLAAKLLACRSGAPIPAAALAPDVTRHDVNWGAEGARRHEYLLVSSDGFALTRGRGPVYGLAEPLWAQGAVGVTSGRHFFSVSVTEGHGGDVKVGWVDRALPTDQIENGPGDAVSPASGATFACCGYFRFGAAPLSANQSKHVPKVECPCTVGCLLDLDAGAMTVFVNGEPLEEQCEYEFLTDREWAPSVSLLYTKDALFSNTV
jgi:hypothetical protein